MPIGHQRVFPAVKPTQTRKAKLMAKRKSKAKKKKIKAGPSPKPARRKKKYTKLAGDALETHSPTSP